MSHIRTCCHAQRTRFCFALMFGGVAAALSGHDSLTGHRSAFGPAETSAQEPRTDSLSDALSPELREAEALLERKEWSAARNAFDLALKKDVEPRSPQARRAVEGGFTCSVQLAEWDDALSRLRRWGNAKPSADISWGMWSNDDGFDAAQAAHLEHVRGLYARLDAALEPAQGPQADKARRRLAEEWLRLDFRLVDVLDSDSDRGYDDASAWWWARQQPDEDVWDDGDFDDSPYQYYYYDQNGGVPLGVDGQPNFVQAPAEYSPGLHRAERVLFLLDEVRRLDPTNRGEGVARALLRRAKIAGELYGPSSNPGWSSAKFYYMYADKPSFESGDDDTWQLADDEALTNVDGRPQVIKLPPSESPLALLRRLEREFPDSQVVPEAIYEQGLYYQSRRQFAQAIAEYNRLIERFPKHRRAVRARDQIKRIDTPGVLLGETGVYAAGIRPALWFACRNAAKAEFKAIQFDFERYIGDLGKGRIDGFWEREPGSALFSFGDNDVWKSYAGNEVAAWEEAIEKTDLVSSHTTQAPITAPGAYVIEARTAGTEGVSRALVVLSGMTIVQRPSGKVLWVVDARTGQPIEGQTVQVRPIGMASNEPNTLITNADGIVEYAPSKDQDAIVVAKSDERGLAFLNLDSYRWHGAGAADHVLSAITDRPVYRPGDAVHFRLWMRELDKGKYPAPKPGEQIEVTITNAQYHTVHSVELAADAIGGATGSFELNSESALGAYTISAKHPTERYADRVATFQVEEYKKPEFEVTVAPAKTHARGGEPLQAQIEARYYFGAPVAGAQARYRVFREELRSRHSRPREYDWLYGAGYGDYAYWYPWLSGPRPEMPEEEYPYMYWGWRARSEFITEGTVLLDQAGSATITVPTEALDRDYPPGNHIYTIVAEVRDESRRVVRGEGKVTVAAREFFASIDLDRGWYRRGQRVVAEVNTYSPNDQPVQTDGSLTLHRVTYHGENKQEVAQEDVGRWEVATDAQGRAGLELPDLQEGQYRLVLQTSDSAGRDVTAEAVFWVHGPAFDGRDYRFSDLEIVPDARSYQVGDTAHLLINTAHADARVMLWDDGKQRYQIVEIAGHSAVIEQVIEEEDAPNFFVQAFLVREGEIHQEQCELFVPPADDLLTVEIRPSRPGYEPGEQGHVTVKVSDRLGQPVAGQVTLSVYNKAVTYIQRESGVGLRSFLTRRKKDAPDPVECSSGGRRFETSGAFVCPEFYLDDSDEGIERIGAMGGAPPQGGDPSNTASRDSSAGRRSRAGEDDDEMPTDAAPLAETHVRARFADTALWAPALELDANGTAETDVVFPEDLTTWRVRAHAMTGQTQVGDAAAEVTTDKDLLVRLQAPRFFVEQDELVLSASVHSDLPGEERVSAELTLPASLFASAAEGNQDLVADAEGNLRLTAEANVQPGGEHRFDWPVHVLKEGLAGIVVKASSGERSDAMRLELPVLTRGVARRQTQAGYYPSSEEGERELILKLPPATDPDKTSIEITCSLGPAAAMLDAIPFLIDYPYGCVEQTMSRFYPAVLAAETLRKLGIDLEAIGKRQREVPAIQTARAARYLAQAVFDSAQLGRVTQAGLHRLYRFQHADGGWGWWEHDDSSRYMTAYVLLGLDVARRSGVAVQQSVIESGVRYLLEARSAEQESSGPGTGDLEKHALIVYVLSLPGVSERKDDEPVKQARRQANSLFSKRQELNLYGKAVLAIAMHNLDQREHASELLTDVLAAVRVNGDGETASVVESDREGWFWWNSTIESQAWVIKALVAIDPDSELAPKLANGLVKQRVNGTWWGSTRDTALAVSALADYLIGARETMEDCTLAVRLNGQAAGEIHIRKDAFLSPDQRIRIDGADLGPGRHALVLSKRGKARLHYACRFDYVTREERMPREGQGLSIERQYFRLVSKAEQPLKGRKGPKKSRPATQRVPLAYGDMVASGDVLEVVLKIKADDTYDYVAVEDMKPAGCEPVQLQSGYQWGEGLCSNVEMRDQKVTFFAPWLQRGEHVLRYKLRAEVPGEFQVLPTRGHAMYAPEIWATSDDMRLGID